MEIRELMTVQWGEKEIVTCPSYGTVERVFVNSQDLVIEWQPLFLIKTEKGTLEQISVGVRGTTESVGVNEREKVIPGTVLAYIKEEGS